MSLVSVLIVLDYVYKLYSILAKGNFREFFRWRGGILGFQKANSRWPWTAASEGLGC